MQKTQLTITLAGGRHIAATAFFPPAGQPASHVIFASPGGSYARAYYDLQIPGHGGYSQAEHHTAQGLILVAYDHLGVGESSTDGLEAMTLEEIAAANHQAVGEIAARIGDGTLLAGYPPQPRLPRIGIGQSMGGGITILMQGRHQTFDAIGVLGFSAIHTVLPQPTRELSDKAAFGADTARSAARVSDFVYPFYWEDVPGDIVDIDMRGGFPERQSSPAHGSPTIPPCGLTLMLPDRVKQEAAAVKTPVFLAFGERDVSKTPHQEPGAFPGSADVTLLIVPAMSHMHNFAGSRHVLWQRLLAWYRTLDSVRA